MLDPLLAIRLTDALDIMLVTALVYTGVVWMRRTQAAQVAAGMLILGGLYVVARAVGLQLTAWIFQGFFAVFVIMIVVIFQEELRQLFERLAVWSFGRGRRAGAAARPAGRADVLVRCLTDFARDRIGALVVLPGEQPIARHVQGGIRLDGALSVPLLKSIFDPHSPGHDGAVIVERDRVTRFAVHLPLSRDFGQLTGVGTRHSAALGLAELTDALCLVVSEERGQVSVAREGRLRVLADANELGDVVEQFEARRRPAPERRRLWEDLVRKNWVEKLASLVLVAGLWYLTVPGGRVVQRTYPVPVEVNNVPNGWELEQVTPRRVAVTFSAPMRTFYLFDPGRLVLQLDLDTRLAKLGRRTFKVSEDNLRYPKQLTVEDIRPAEVKVSLRKAPGGERSAAGT